MITISIQHVKNDGVFSSFVTTSYLSYHKIKSDRYGNNEVDREFKRAGTGD